MSGYFMVQRRSIANHTLDPKGYKILLEVIGRGQVNTIKEVGYIFQERQSGESKVTWRQYIDYLHHLVKLRSGGRVTRFRQSFPMKRFLQFGLVGLTGVVVDMGLLYLLSDPTTLGLGLTRSKVIASELAIMNNFLWNDQWTFGDIARQQKNWNLKFKRFLKFNFVCLIGLSLNVILLNLMFNLFFQQFIWGRYVANFIAIAIVTFWNFWINLKLSWRVTDTQNSQNSKS
jgi:dolichol-phosphate mannosyltransferase